MGARRRREARPTLLATGEQSCKGSGARDVVLAALRRTCMSRARTHRVFLLLLVAGATEGCTAAEEVTTRDPLQQQAVPAEAATPADRPDDEEVTVQITGDEGCGAFAHAVGPSGMQFTSIFDNVAAEQDERGRTGAACTLRIDYTFPAGWTFDAPGAVARGYAHADERSALRLRLSSALDGRTLTNSRSFRSSAVEDYTLAVDEAAPAGGSVPCGATRASMVMTVEAAAFGSGVAALHVDSLDGRITWRRCQ
jgi:hypothetical protein